MNVANGYWLPILKLRGIPTVVNVDGIEWHREKWGRLAKAMFRRGARLTAKFADHLIFDARAIEDFWMQQFGRTGTFIPYGGETAGALPVEPGLVSQKYALMVARFVPENTISEFVEATEEISREFDVVLVGSAPEGSVLQREVSALADRNDRVHWLGHISDDQRLYALWQHAGAYFHGHSVGGTNPALVQAMTIGVPIVARDTVYNREVLARAGTYVEPTAASIATGMKSMIRDSAEYRTSLSIGRRQRIRGPKCGKPTTTYCSPGLANDDRPAAKALRSTTVAGSRRSDVHPRHGHEAIRQKVGWPATHRPGCTHQEPPVPFPFWPACNRGFCRST